MPLLADPPHTAFETVAPSLLQEVDEATALLAASPTIPEDVRDLVVSFEEVLRARSPEIGLAGIDPYLAEALLGGALVCAAALNCSDERESRRRMRLGLEQVRQALRDIVDEAPVGGDRPAKDLVRWLDQTLGATQSDLADVLGVSKTSLQRWLATEASLSSESEARVRVVARIANHLRHSFTGPGVLKWFERPHPMLSDARPRDLLDDPTQFPALVRLAARSRSMVAA